MCISRFKDKEIIVDEITKELEQIDAQLINRFSCIRTRAYQKIIPSHAIPLQKYNGRALYLVPMDEVIPLREDWEKEIVEELRKLDQEIRVYLRSNAERLVKVRKYFKQKFGKEITFDIPPLAERAKLDLTPFNIDFQVWRDYLEEQHRQQVIELTQKRREMIDELEREIEEEKQRQIEAAANAIKDQVAQALGELVADISKKTKQEKLTENLKKIRRRAQSLGLIHVGDLDKLLSVGIEICESYQDNAKLDIATRHLSDLLKVSGTSLAETISKAQKKLREEAPESPRLKKLKAELIA